jgi:ribonuclease-3
VLWKIQPSRYSAATEVEAKIGYLFKSREFLFEALTHRSAFVGLDEVTKDALNRRPWNERFEFLGDSVLGLVISEALLAAHGALSEGEMSRIRAAIVCEANLATIARERLELSKALVLGPSELGSGGRDKVSLLADALEAILGAVFTDGGWESARSVIQALFANELTGDLRRFLEGDAKTTFQELAQEKLKLTPTYAVTDEKGPAHQRSFEVSARLGEDEWGRAWGASKKEAAQLAARSALERMKEISP